MTWNPLKRNYLTQRPTPAQSLISHTEDRDLDVAVQRLIYAGARSRYLGIGAVTDRSQPPLRIHFEARSLTRGLPVFKYRDTLIGCGTKNVELSLISNTNIAKYAALAT